MKNIEIMHSMFGELPEHKCGECRHIGKKVEYKSYERLKDEGKTSFRKAK